MWRKITLKSSSGETFEVDKAVAFKSQTINDLFDGNDADTVIPLSQVTGPILAKVIEYCEKHETNADELDLWDRNFVYGINKATLFDLLLAADYLCIQDLLNLTCDRVALRIFALTPQEIRTYYSTREE